ncbi:MAG: formate--tetrahydrofolate ligase, partial [Spirochaetota bacterium]
MKLDPTQLKDWQIAEAAEKTMKPIARVAAEMGLQEEDWIPYGRNLAKVDYRRVLDRLGDRQQGEALVLGQRLEVGEGARLVAQVHLLADLEAEALSLPGVLKAG